MFKTKPFVLFVTERWCDGKSSAGFTNCEHNLFGSLEASGLADHECLFIDQYFQDYGRRLDATLLNCVRARRPDIIVISHLFGSDLNLEHTTLRELNNMQIPLVFFWWDTAYEGRMEFADRMAVYADLNVVVDRQDFKTKYPEKTLGLWVPQDTTIFCNPHRDRDIDISFIGRVDGHPRRTSAIRALRAAGLNVVYYSNGQRESQLGIEEYADVLQRSKIALNFSWTLDRVPGVSHQAKARIYEATLCGAMLLESDNPHTMRWFDPFKEYVPFFSEDDLVKRATYFLEQNTTYRQEIADCGCKKASSLYNAEKFWTIVMRSTHHAPGNRPCVSGDGLPSCAAR